MTAPPSTENDTLPLGASTPAAEFPVGATDAVSELSVRQATDGLDPDALMATVVAAWSTLAVAVAIQEPEWAVIVCGPAVSDEMFRLAPWPRDTLPSEKEACGIVPLARLAVSVRG